MTARVGVITFPGSLDDADAARAVGRAGAEPVPLWHGDHDLRGLLHPTPVASPTAITCAAGPSPGSRR